MTRRVLSFVFAAQLVAFWLLLGAACVFTECLSPTVPTPACKVFVAMNLVLAVLIIGMATIAGLLVAPFPTAIISINLFIVIANVVIWQ